MQKSFRLTDILLRTALVGLVGCGTPAVNSGGSGGGNGNGNGNGGGNGSSSGAGGIAIGPVGTTPPGGQGGAQEPSNQPSMENNCGVKKIDLQKQPADLLLVLDRSRSMIQGPGGNNNRGDGGVPVSSKWTEVVAAIDPVIMRTQSQVAWGLKLYPLGETCGVPDGATVAVGTGTYDSVMTAIRANDPAMGTGGSTPTRLAVEKATEFMKTHPSPNAKYLVLATDGQPNCGSNGRNGDDEAGAIASIAAAATAGISTFVVGVATTGSDAHDTLNEMAIKGGHARGDATKYYPVASRDELVSALETITGQIASCTFPLSPAPPVPDNVAVEIDGQRVARDNTATNGWSYGPQNSSVILHGALCDGLKAGTAKNVQILYGCPGVTIN